MTRALVVAIALLAAGCIGYETKLGAAFTAQQIPPERGLVYLYRPAKLAAWMRPVHVVIAGQERIVMVEGYAVLALPAGTYRVTAYSTGTAQNFVAIGFGGSRWTGSTEITATMGRATYLRLEASLGSTEVREVREAEAQDEIGGLHLSAGGALR